MTMLDRMRRHKNWLKWSLALVCVAFVVLYIPSFLRTDTPAAHTADRVASVDSRSITMAIGEALGVALDAGTPQHELLKGIGRALLAHARAEQRVVLFIDECQAMPLETLETVRLLSNLETDKRKLLQVAMFGPLHFPAPRVYDAAARVCIRM